MSLTQEEKITVLFDEFFIARDFLISINQEVEDELDRLTKFHINRALFHCKPFVMDNSFDGRNGIAYFNHNKILFNLNDLDYDFDKEIFDPQCVIIHEITHLLLYYFSILYDHKPMTEHNLEFVIFNYALFYRYTNSLYQLRPYDIQDEKYFDHSKINLVKFGSFIKAIKFKNLNQLYLKSVELSNKIREKKRKTFLSKMTKSIKDFLKRRRA